MFTDASKDTSMMLMPVNGPVEEDSRKAVLSRFRGAVMRGVDYDVHKVPFMSIYANIHGYIRIYIHVCMYVYRSGLRCHLCTSMICVLHSCTYMTT
jgi:hypothetical protein